MNAFADNEIYLNLLKLLQVKPRITQREMNKEMGVSVGKINYCIAALSEKGMIKIERFNKSKNKTAYMYLLTPKGLEEIARLTVCFLKIKVKEYNQIRQEIQSLYQEVDQNILENNDDIDLLSDLENFSKL